jgi:WD40 repeat protein
MPNSSTVVGASITHGAFFWHTVRDTFKPLGIAEATSVAANTTSARIAVGTRPGKVLVLDAETLKPFRSWTLDTTIMSSRFSTDGRLLAVSTNPDRHLWKASGHLLNVETGQVLLDLPGAKWRNLAFSPDGRRLYVSITSVDHVEVWDTDQLEHIDTVCKHDSAILQLAVTPDGRYLVSISSMREIMIRDLTNETEATLLPQLEGEFGTFTIDPSGRSLLVVDSTGLVRACSIRAARDIVDLAKLDLGEGVLQLQFNREGQLLILDESQRVGIAKLLEH